MSSNVRPPKDDDEKIRAQIAILQGKAKPLKEVIADLLGEEPEQVLVDAVENNILLAQEQGGSIDLSAVLKSIQSMSDKWA
ncbi:hypothetical protein N9Y75_02860 [Candidatus Poseidoniales archaeon]|nr:hypothetical protein [Candidatus Poseidoniales archaeon]MDA8715791.1 hypothetical protein [Candidatus Poseidoniales archaeon]MDA8717764.1 hypothetical protein [Candidatus Poseidoniales archaeon]MDB2671769.1 hypothetical protein [Candidatus Poseidoniales archaeon]